MLSPDRDPAPTADKPAPNVWRDGAPVIAADPRDRRSRLSATKAGVACEVIGRALQALLGDVERQIVPPKWLIPALHLAEARPEGVEWRERRGGLCAPVHREFSFTLKVVPSLAARGTNMNRRQKLLLAGLGIVAVWWLAASDHDPNAKYPQPPAASAAAAAPLGVPDFAPESRAAVGPYEVAHSDDACTEDCSGHEAGYQWAEEHDITDEDDCDGKSESFIEGCKAYVADNG